MLHGSFAVTKDLAAPVARVWAAYADPALRARWYRIPGSDSHHALDFRVGGQERLWGSFASTGTVEQLTNTASFHDIVQHERIVFTYEVTLDGVRRWVSLVALAFQPLPNGTRLTHTEHYTFLAWSGSGADDEAHLPGSVQLSLNALAKAVEPT